MNKYVPNCAAIILVSISFGVMSESSVVSIKKTPSSTTIFEKFTQASPQSEFAFELSINSLEPEQISIEYTYNKKTQTAYEITAKEKETIIFPSIGKYIVLENPGLHVFNIEIGNETFERTIYISNNVAAVSVQKKPKRRSFTKSNLKNNYIPKNEDVGHVGSYEVQDTRSIGSDIYKLNASSTPLIINNDYMGTGSIISLAGEILTNWHVIQGAGTVQVAFKPKGFEKLDARQFYIADIIKTDEVHDLALLQLRNIPEKMRKIPLASVDDIEVAMDVHAIGHPKGNLWTYTNGVVSQLRPDYEWTDGEFKHTADVIQTQTPINPGNSGGPLFNNLGEIVGVNSFIDQDADGLNYAIAVSTIKEFIVSDIVHNKTTTIKKDDKDEGVWFDQDGDGINESVGLDEDHNGEMDALYVDTDGDGALDTFYFDANENEIAELTVVIIILDSGSKVAVFYYDTNEDEVIESKGYDFDMDGEVDEVEAT